MAEALTFDAKLANKKTKQDKFGSVEAILTFKVVADDAESEFGPLDGLIGSKVRISIDRIEQSATKRDEDF